jgi:hypothetical protein
MTRGSGDRESTRRPRQWRGPQSFPRAESALTRRACRECDSPSIGPRVVQSAGGELTDLASVEDGTQTTVASRFRHGRPDVGWPGGWRATRETARARRRSGSSHTPSFRLVVQPVNLGATTIGHESVVGSLVNVTAPLPVCVATMETFMAPVATNEEPPPPPLLLEAVPPPAP